MALLDNPLPQGAMPVTPEQAEHALSTGLFENDPALNMVLRDTTRAEQFESAKAWITGWNAASILFQSPPSAVYWENTSVPRSNLPLFTVATAVNSVRPQILSGMFFEDPPYLLQERPGTSADTAEAVGDLIGYQLEDIEFRKALDAGVTNAILYGSAIFKYGWSSETKVNTIYRRKDNSVELPSGSPDVPPIPLEPDDENIEIEEIEENIERPFFDNITNLRHVLVDPTLQVPNIKKAKYVIHRMYMTFDDLDKLRERPGYKIPSRKDLLMLFFPPRELADAAPMDDAVRNSLWDIRSDTPWDDSTVDPFSQPLEVLERWDNKTCIVVLQKKLVILNDKNPYNEIPFLNINWMDVPEAFYGMGFARAQPLDAKLLTPSGWKKMGDALVGDQVFGSDGKPHKITGVFPQGEKTVYRVNFSDGSSTECCGEHLWCVEKSRRKGITPPSEIVQLQDIWNNLKMGKSHRYFIPTTSPVEFERKTLPLDPYLVGLLLGDGGMTDSLSFATKDSELVTSLEDSLPFGVSAQKQNDGIGHKLSKKGVFGNYPNPLKESLKEIGIYGLGCDSKFIPESYKFSSVEQRRMLLAGLMDTDGSSAGGSTKFYSVSKQLCDDVQFLVESLGGRAKKTKPQKNKSRGVLNGKFTNVLHVSFSNYNPFRLQRKRDTFRPTVSRPSRRAIVSIESVGVKPCQCIMVDVPNHLYLTDHCIVTHNTIGSEQRLQQGLINTYVDNATLNLQGVYTRVRGKSVPVENIRIAPGRIVNVENKDDFKPLERTAPVPEVTQHIAMSQARVEQVGAVSEIASQGVAGSSGHSNLARTAAGANLLGGGAANRISDFVDKLAQNVVVPFLYKVHEMNRALLPTKTIRQIFNEELQHAYFRNGGDIVEILNARVKFSILAGSKMAARRTMAQALPILTQFLMNPEVMEQLQIEQKKVDIDQVLKMFFEASDWKDFYSVVVPMKPDEIQRAQANSPAAIQQMKIQAAQAQQAQQYEQKAQLLDDSTWGKAANTVIRNTIEQSANPEAISGVGGGGVGFGSQV